MVIWMVFVAVSKSPSTLFLMYKVLFAVAFCVGEDMTAIGCTKVNSGSEYLEIGPSGPKSERSAPAIESRQANDLLLAHLFLNLFP